MIGLGAIAVLEIKLGSSFRTCANDLAAEFFHESGAQKFFVQTQPSKGLHAERQERFADVKARKFFALEHDHAPASAREQRRSNAASRSSSDDRDIVHGGVHHALSLANFRGFGRDAALRCNGVSISRICIPLGAIAVGCTAICLWLNVQAAPAAQEKLRSTIFDLATRNPMALFGSDQVIDQFPGRKIYVGKKEGNKLENITVFELSQNSMPVKVTYARTGMLEADLANKQILMHLYQARYQERDPKDPTNLRKIRDGINMVEGTLPISLEELYNKEKKRPSRSALSIEQLLEQLKSEDKRERSASRTEINKRFSFPFACVAFAIIGVPLGVTAHRRETSIGFAMGLIVATTYFLFVIIGDTLRGNPHAHPELLVWFPNVLFIILGVFLFRRLARQ